MWEEDTETPSLEEEVGQGEKSPSKQFGQGKKSGCYRLLDKPTNKQDRQIDDTTEKQDKENKGYLGGYPVDAVLNLYHSTCTRLPKVRVLTDKRKKAIQAILKKYSLDDLKEAFQKVNRSDFCCGRNDTGWKADIDFILREDKLVNILEGKYENGGGVSNTIEHGVKILRGDVKKFKEDIANGNAIKF